MTLPSNCPEDLLPKYKYAYNALPACYRADSCLRFYEALGHNGIDIVLKCDYDLGGTYLWNGEYWVAVLPNERKK